MREGLDFLLAKDPFFKRSKIDIQTFVWPYMGPGLPGLVRIVIGQQVSTAAAATMWARFQEKVPQVTPKAIMALTADDMRALGLSRQKSAYISGLAQAVATKTFDFGALTKLQDDAITEAITAVKGLGPWSAQMYLMFALGRPDIWPAGDLGIQEGLRIYLGKDERPGIMETLLEGKRFTPHRTAASLLLWHTKSREAKG